MASNGKSNGGHAAKSPAFNGSAYPIEDHSYDVVVITFRHLQLGLQAVIEDYVHGERTKTVSLLLLRGAAGLAALIGVLAALKLAFSG